MTNLNSVKHCENMFALEFDLQQYPIHGAEDDPVIQLNRRFRVIDQAMIETMIHYKLRANCHGHSLFNPAEYSLSFAVSGKKIIKSI